MTKECHCKAGFPLQLRVTGNQPETLVGSNRLNSKAEKRLECRHIRQGVIFMPSKCRSSIAAVLVLVFVMLFSMPVQARFPEFGFCPLGGPPGWFNRMTGQHRKWYPPPPAYGPPYPPPSVRHFGMVPNLRNMPYDNRAIPDYRPRGGMNR